MADFLKLTVSVILLNVAFFAILHFVLSEGPGPEKGLYLHKSGDVYLYCQINNNGYQLMLKNEPETDPIRLSYTLNSSAQQTGNRLINSDILSYDDKSLVM